MNSVLEISKRTEVLFNNRIKLIGEVGNYFRFEHQDSQIHLLARKKEKSSPSYFNKVMGVLSELSETSNEIEKENFLRKWGEEYSKSRDIKAYDSNKKVIVSLDFVKKINKICSERFISYSNFLKKEFLNHYLSINKIDFRTTASLLNDHFLRNFSEKNNAPLFEMFKNHRIITLLPIGCNLDYFKGFKNGKITIEFINYFRKSEPFNMKLPYFISKNKFMHFDDCLHFRFEEISYSLDENIAIINNESLKKLLEEAKNYLVKRDESISISEKISDEYFAFLSKWKRVFEKENAELLVKDSSFCEETEKIDFLFNFRVKNLPLEKIKKVAANCDKEVFILRNFAN